MALTCHFLCWHVKNKKPVDLPTTNSNLSLFFQPDIIF